MELLLWRHAEAEDGAPDDARELTARGRRQAEAIAQWLRTRQPQDLRIIASPTKRTQQTARHLARTFDTDPRVGTGGDYRSLLAASGWPDAKVAVLVVGHQPTLGQAISFLLTGRPADMSVKKGALWWITTRERDGVTHSGLKASITAELAEGD